MLGEPAHDVEDAVERQTRCVGTYTLRVVRKLTRPIVPACHSHVIHACLARGQEIRQFSIAHLPFVLRSPRRGSRLRRCEHIYVEGRIVFLALERRRRRDAGTRHYRGRRSEAITTVTQCKMGARAR